MNLELSLAEIRVQIHTLATIQGQILALLRTTIGLLRNQSTPLPATKTDLSELEARLSRTLNSMAATLDQILQDVTDESSVIDSVTALIQGLKQQIADALTGTTLPPAVQAKVDAIFSTAEANKEKLAQALVDNTPADIINVSKASE
jgi:hypothetical protein